jgi:hypothetical protein
MIDQEVLRACPTQKKPQFFQPREGQGCLQICTCRGPNGGRCRRHLGWRVTKAAVAGYTMVNWGLKDGAQSTRYEMHKMLMMQACRREAATKRWGLARYYSDVALWHADEARANRVFVQNTTTFRLQGQMMPGTHPILGRLAKRQSGQGPGSISSAPQAEHHEAPTRLDASLACHQASNARYITSKAKPRLGRLSNVVNPKSYAHGRFGAAPISRPPCASYLDTGRRHRRVA